jgi:hypothetical protein
MSNGINGAQILPNIYVYILIIYQLIIMRKDSRLSFRISESMSDRIDRAIGQTGGQIRDRSEFGTKAVQFYLDFIENAHSMEELMSKSILALADHIGIESNEIKQIRALSKQKTRIPKMLADVPSVESHPRYNDAVNLYSELKEEEQKKLSYELRDAGYEDIDKIYQKYEKLID